jgi:hypothetical protein
MIEEVSSNITDYIGFPLARQTYFETLEGQGRPRILLQARPVDRDSLTVTVNGLAFTDFTLERGRSLYRPFGWFGRYWDSAYTGVGDASGRALQGSYLGPTAGLFDVDENVSVTYRAGYLLPGQVSTWTTGASLALGAWIRPSRASLSPWLFEVTTAGLAGIGEPVYPSLSGSTVTDGTAILTARDAQELPAVIRKAAALAVVYDFEQRPAGLTSQGVDSYRESYDSKAQGDLPLHVCKILERLRSDF